MSFLVLVPTKRVPDTDGVIRVTPDGLDVDTSHLSFVINPFDAIAVEEALRLRERREDVEVVVVGIGDEAYEDELRTALAMGADRAIRVDAAEPLDPWNVACVLSELARRLEPRLLLMGKQNRTFHTLHKLLCQLLPYFHLVELLQQGMPPDI